METNALQFARQGNPWDGEPVLKGKARKARRKAGLRPCRPGAPRLVERQSREGDERIAELNFWSGFDARRAVRTRTLVPEKSPTLAKIEPLTREIHAPARTELTGWQRFERQVVRVRQKADFAAKAEAAEMAYRASEAYRIAERRKLEAMRDAIEARLELI